MPIPPKTNTQLENPSLNGLHTLALRLGPVLGTRVPLSAALAGALHAAVQHPEDAAEGARAYLQSTGRLPGPMLPEQEGQSS